GLKVVHFGTRFELSLQALALIRCALFETPIGIEQPARADSAPKRVDADPAGDRGRPGCQAASAAKAPLDERADDAFEGALNQVLVIGFRGPKQAAQRAIDHAVDAVV